MDMKVKVENIEAIRGKFTKTLTNLAALEAEGLSLYYSSRQMDSNSLRNKMKNIITEFNQELTELAGKVELTPAEKESGV